jgi:low temperature requirement protein LtrA
VMQGMESQDGWTVSAAMSAFLGMGIAFLTWWWYFDGVAGASEQPVRSHREAVRFHVWAYAHFPLYLGIVVTGVGVHRIVAAALRAAVTIGEATILTSAAVVVMLAMTAIGVASAGRRHKSRTAVKNLALCAATLTAGIIVGAESPLALIITIAGFSLAQLIVTLDGCETGRVVAVQPALEHQ